MFCGGVRCCAGWARGEPVGQCMWRAGPRWWRVDDEWWASPPRDIMYISSLNALAAGCLANFGPRWVQGRGCLVCLNQFLPHARAAPAARARGAVACRPLHCIAACQHKTQLDCAGAAAAPPPHCRLWSTSSTASVNTAPQRGQPKRSMPTCGSSPATVRVKRGRASARRIRWRSSSAAPVTHQLLPPAVRRAAHTVCVVSAGRQWRAVQRPGFLLLLLQRRRTRSARCC